jgi:hypothetical protein
MTKPNSSAATTGGSGPRAKRRHKKLAPSQKYEVFTAVLTSSATQRGAGRDLRGGWIGPRYVSPGPSRGRSRLRSGPRSSTCSTRSGSWTWYRVRYTRSCSTRAATCARSSPCTGCCARPTDRSGNAAVRRPPATGQARAPRPRTKPVLVVGLHQAGRAGEVDLLLPVLGHRHLLPLHRRLDGRHP